MIKTLVEVSVFWRKTETSTLECFFKILSWFMAYISLELWIWSCPRITIFYGFEAKVF